VFLPLKRGRKLGWVFLLKKGGKRWRRGISNESIEVQPPEISKMSSEGSSPQILPLPLGGGGLRWRRETLKMVKILDKISVTL